LVREDLGISSYRPSLRDPGVRLGHIEVVVVRSVV
jgi:hypothetical protein